MFTIGHRFYWLHFFPAYWCKNINIQVGIATLHHSRLPFQRGKFPSQQRVTIFEITINPTIMIQIADDEADEEVPPPIIYEDKDTDDEESEVDAMETDREEAEELGDVTDASENSDGSEIMSDWLTFTLPSTERFGISIIPIRWISRWLLEMVVLVLCRA